jgi:integrase
MEPMADITKRTTREGDISYRVRIRLRGFPLQSATFASKSKAKEWAQATESAMKEGRHFKHSESKKHTLGDLIDRYIRDVLPTKPKSQRKQSAQLGWWKGRLGKYLLSDVTPALIVEHRDLLMQGATVRGKQRSPATVVRYMAVLSHAFTIAVKEWGWLDDTPMRKVTKPKEPRGRIRFLSEDERRRLLHSCKNSKSPLLYPVVVLALSTGMRQGEVMNLSWKDVDLDKKSIVLHNTKNGERRSVPLAGHAFTLLLEHSKRRRLDTFLLFPGQDPKKPIDLRYAWETALTEAKIEDFRFHDLRHSAASYLAMGKATLAEIADILGHKTLQMVKRYAHLSESHTAGVVARMNESIFADVGADCIENRG